MKRIILIALIVLITFLSSCEKEEAQVEYRIITTTFSNNESHLLEFSNGVVISDKMYEIRGVEYYYNINRLLIYSAYDNQVINTNTSESFEIPFNPYDMIDDGNGKVMIHTNGINKFVIIRYDENFNIIKKSIDFDGTPNKMIYYDDQLFILNNKIDEHRNRYTVVSVVDNDTFILTDEWIIDDMIFGFNMELHNNKLSMFGHNSFDNEYLYIATLALETLEENFFEFNNNVMWVKSCIYKNDLLYVVNHYSIIVINSNNQIVRVYENNMSIIDFHYVNNDLIYILQGDFNQNVFEVVIATSEFEIIDKYPIIVDGTRPTRIIID